MNTRDNKSKIHGKKIIAPVIVTVILLIYYLFFFGALLTFMDSIVLKIMFGIIPALSGAVLIGVCIDRIREIKGGEEDDLSQY